MQYRRLGTHGPTVSALGLGILALHIIKDEPEFYHFFGEKEFTWSKIRQVSRNPLLTMDIGADGLITCNVEEPGFGLIGSLDRANDAGRFFRDGPITQPAEPGKDTGEQHRCPDSE